MTSHPGDKSPGYIRMPLTGLNNIDAKTKPDKAHSNYGEILPIPTHSQFEALILDQRYNIKDWAIELLQRQDVRPRVAMSDDGCGVTIFTYSRYYGFGWRKYKIAGKNVHEETYEQLTWPVCKIKY